MSRMAETGRVTTAEELFAMADDDHSYELLYGELHRMSKPGFRHGVITSRLLVRLGVYVEQHDLGQLTGETGYLLDRNPDTEVQILGKDGVLDGGDVVPGFRLPVRELFA